MSYSRFPLLVVLAASSAAAQSGHWEGSIQAPQATLNLVVDLTQDAVGRWMGTMAVPAQNVKGIALGDIAVQGTKVQFTVKGAPGHQSFEGTLAADGKTLSGNFSTAGQPMACKFTRTGEAKYEAPPKSTAITKDIEGDWEGLIDANGHKYHLKLHLANDADGATGSIVSVDQGGQEIPVGVITQTGTSLKLELPLIGGTYAGTVAAGGKEINGNWTQGPGTVPLNFRRPAK